jgi:3-dehydroquinate dehydratase II
MFYVLCSMFYVFVGLRSSECLHEEQDKFLRFLFTIVTLMKILIINGPNLNLLGKREPEIYGSETFEAYFEKLKAAFPQVQLEYYQSNVEGELINKLHETGFSYDGILLNAGGYTHTSVALADAVAAIKTPVIEVHISNIFAREEIRHISLLSKHCKGIISGLGLEGYRMGVGYFL